MVDEEFQFAISQYLDGSLPAEKIPAVEARLATDAEAKSVLAEFRRVNDLVAGAFPLPEMDWDRLSQEISRAIDEEEKTGPLLIASAAEHADLAERSTWWAGRWAYAMAAGVLLAITVGVIFWKMSGVGGMADRAGVIAELPGHDVATPAAKMTIEVCPGVNLSGDAVAEIRVSQTLAPEVGLADLYPDSTSLDGSSVAISAVAGKRQADAELDLPH